MISYFRVEELKSIMRKCGLPLAGKKDELKRRIITHLSIEPYSKILAAEIQRAYNASREAAVASYLPKYGCMHVDTSDCDEPIITNWDYLNVYVHSLAY